MRTKTTIFYIGDSHSELIKLGPNIVNFSESEVMDRILRSNRICNVIKINNIYFVVEFE